MRCMNRLNFWHCFTSMLLRREPFLRRDGESSCSRNYQWTEESLGSQCNGLRKFRTAYSPTCFPNLYPSSESYRKCMPKYTLDMAASNAASEKLSNERGGGAI